MYPPLKSGEYGFIGQKFIWPKKRTMLIGKTFAQYLRKHQWIQILIPIGLRAQPQIQKINKDIQRRTCVLADIGRALTVLWIIL